MVDISERLKSLRKEHKLSQKQVSEILGISESGYGYYEQGRNEPSIEMIKKLADRYDVTTDYLLGLSNSPDKDASSTNEDFDSLKEINKLLVKYDIDDMAFFDIEKWKSMTPEQIRELESYFQYLVQKSKELEEEKKK
ncbi:helix-turn-helix domain-containing protein [Halobacillus shinanisalinarum]|uniref:Helix-turn-helix domain-containing protein n=1 Tax=Halobacillus shinanisalinarum TaxID=2932258 RepID=A0ABY4H3R8_9BACI|nr:helix-turn-helix transcriptional regulator [Halobacillus shinanisalinarum]UOQ95097.1 helix-turn-helix domain-containing protein [Halobacillus shinanisalinarum]